MDAITGLGLPMATLALPLKRHLQRLRPLPAEVAQGYAWIGLMPSWRAGALLLALTFVQPVMGAAGLLCAVVAWLAAALAGAEEGERPVAVFNGLLIGLLAASTWQPGVNMLTLAVLGSACAGWGSVVLGRLAWQALRLPVLSLPFALVGMLLSATSGSLYTLQWRAHVDAAATLLGSWADPFLSALGGLYFLPDPRVGAVVLAVLFVFSRYYLVLALAGYGAAAGVLTLMGAQPATLVSTAWDCNAVLAALLVGGLMATPSLVTAALGMAAAVVAAWLSLALARVLGTAQLAPMSLPFVLAVWLVLSAVLRHVHLIGRFNLHAPDAPERTHERARISRARVGHATSVALAPPFAGRWTVSQGFSGPHTHRGIWRHALDFIVMHEGRSFAGSGAAAGDFHAQGQPVLSPACGQVWRTVNDVPDNLPGNVNAAANWGNCVVIRLQDGHFVVLAHLQPGSVAVAPGAWVSPGMLLGRCGNSGRSPQPHIHLHVQAGDQPGAPTVPFHLAGVQVGPAGQVPSYHLATVPAQGDEVTAVAATGYEVRPFHLLAGRGLQYTVTCTGHGQQAPARPRTSDWTVRSEVDGQGRLRLISSAGAHCLAESTGAVFSCYGRGGAADPVFDAWLLACGYTPASYDVTRWTDTGVLARLLPRRWVRTLSVLLWPWAAFAESRHERDWDATAQVWRQRAVHRQQATGLSVQTECAIAPQVGCVRLAFVSAQGACELQAVRLFQVADLGVPGWEVALGGA